MPPKASRKRAESWREKASRLAREKKARDKLLAESKAKMPTQTERMAAAQKSTGKARTQTQKMADAQKQRGDVSTLTKAQKGKTQEELMAGAKKTSKGKTQEELMAGARKQTKSTPTQAEAKKSTKGRTQEELMANAKKTSKGKTQEELMANAKKTSKGKTQEELMAGAKKTTKRIPTQAEAKKQTKRTPTQAEAKKQTKRIPTQAEAKKQTKRTPTQAEAKRTNKGKTQEELMAGAKKTSKGRTQEELMSDYQKTSKGRTQEELMSGAEKTSLADSVRPKSGRTQEELMADYQAANAQPIADPGYRSEMEDRFQADRAGTQDYRSGMEQRFQADRAGTQDYRSGMEKRFQQQADQRVADQAGTQGYRSDMEQKFEADRAATQGYRSGMEQQFEADRAGTQDYRSGMEQKFEADRAATQDYRSGMEQQFQQQKDFQQQQANQQQMANAQNQAQVRSDMSNFNDYASGPGRMTGITSALQGGPQQAENSIMNMPEITDMSDYARFPMIEQATQGVIDPYKGFNADPVMNYAEGRMGNEFNSPNTQGITNYAQRNAMQGIGSGQQGNEFGQRDVWNQAAGRMGNVTPEQQAYMDFAQEGMNATNPWDQRRIETIHGANIGINANFDQARANLENRFATTNQLGSPAFRSAMKELETGRATQIGQTTANFNMAAASGDQNMRSQRLGDFGGAVDQQGRTRQQNFSNLDAASQNRQQSGQTMQGIRSDRLSGLTGGAGTQMESNQQQEDVSRGRLADLGSAGQLGLAATRDREQGRGNRLNQLQSIQGQEFDQVRTKQQDQMGVISDMNATQRQYDKDYEDSQYRALEAQDRGMKMGAQALGSLGNPMGAAGIAQSGFTNAAAAGGAQGQAGQTSLANALTTPGVTNAIGDVANWVGDKFTGGYGGGIAQKGKKRVGGGGTSGGDYYDNPNKPM